MYAFQNFLVTNIINAFFVTLWFCCLVPETRYERKKTLLGLTGACAVMDAPDGKTALARLDKFFAI